MIYGTLAAYGVASPAQEHFGGSAKEIPGIGQTGYIGLTAFVLNVAVTVVLTFVLKAAKAPEGIDGTSPGGLHRGCGSNRSRVSCHPRPGTSPAPEPGREPDPRTPTPSP